MQDVPAEAGNNSGKKIRKLQKCKRTPVFKYPNQKQEVTESINDGKDRGDEDQNFENEANQAVVG